MERHAKAMIAQDFGRLMADLTPEAMAQAQAAGAGFQTLTGYEIESHTQEGDEHTFQVKYTGPSATLSIRETWRKIGTDWQVVAIARA